MASLFQFYVFGPPRLMINEQPVALPPQPAALCAFLILNRQRRVTREEVQVAFWPDAEPARAQERLRRALYLLRRAVEPHTELIQAEGAELAVTPGLSLWVDYEVFEQVLIDAYRHDPPRRQPLEEAVALYKDDLLKDNYADWVLLEREHARQQFLTALRHLIGVCQQAGDWTSVIQYGHQLLEHDPFQELAHRALMMAYASTGDRSAALRQYQQCVRILDDELGVEPLPETIRLYEAILHGRGVIDEVALPPAPLPPAPLVDDMSSIPLVGREQELAEIAAEWQFCLRHHSRLVLVMGPAGVGKTRLVEEAAYRIPGPGVTVLTGHCYAMEAGTPYQLIADLMNQAAPRVAGRLSPTVRGDLTMVVPALLDSGEGSLPGRVAPDAAVRLQEAVAQVIRLLASSGEGLWLIAEDLHWADPASLACLNYALRQGNDRPLLVLATLRDEEVSYDSPLLDWPTSSVHAPAPTTLIRVPPLPFDQLETLVSRLIGAGVAPLASLLHIETAGNPFFVVETLRALAEQGVLYREPGGEWRLRMDVLPQPTGLPMSDVVLRVIQGRVRRLSRPAQEVLTVAAVLEHDIEEPLLAALVDPSVALDLALDEILRAYVLVEATPGLYQFAHTKVREIIYADTSAPRRRFLHRHAAERLAQRSGEMRLADSAKLAYHYEQAREWTLALIHAWRASQTALQAGAMAEANRFAETAQRILDEHGAELDLPDLPEPLSAIRFDLLALRAEFRRQAATGGLYYPPDLMQAIEALLPAVDESRQARAALQQASHRLGQGDLAGARDAAAHARALFAGLRNLWGELNAVQHQLDVAYYAGEMVALGRGLDDMRGLAARLDRPDIRPVIDGNEMRLAVYQGDWMKVLTLAQALVAGQSNHRDPAVAWLPLANLGMAYLKLGLVDEAQRYAQQAVAASEDAGVLGLGARVLLAKLALWRGQPDEARRMLTDLLETPDPLIGESEVVAPALLLVRCCVAEGDADEAKRWAQRASAAVSRIRLPVLFPLSQVAWALTRLAAGQLEEARKRLVYPLELMALLEDTAPQEIFVLRAAAARALHDESTAADWLSRALAEVRQQAERISDPAYRDSFLHRTPLHRFILDIASGVDWQPDDVLHLSTAQPEL